MSHDFAAVVLLEMDSLDSCRFVNWPQQLYVGPEQVRERSQSKLDWKKRVYLFVHHKTTSWSLGGSLPRVGNPLALHPGSSQQEPQVRALSDTIKYTIPQLKEKKTWLAGLRSGP